jgi:hypothetical protein
MKEYKSQSTEIPKEWDLASSGTTVYNNTNIEILPAMGDTPQMYDYDVKEYTRAEYETLAVKQTRADVDYIAVITGVAL